MHATNSAVKDSLVVGQSSQGVEFRASLLRLTRLLAVFEIYNPALVLRLSEVLTDFKIIISDRTVYSGRATISNLVNAGAVLVCEVKLEEGSFGLRSHLPLAETEHLRDGFTDFLSEWQKLYRVLPEFKIVVADMQTFLYDLRLWLEQVELEIRSAPSGDRVQLERDMAVKLSGPVVQSIDAFIERFETIAAGLSPELEPVHRVYIRRQLHPLILGSPFAYRAFHKPLGYAGDYEVINMMLRPPEEGSTLFAKIINIWLLGQAPAQAHRNRVDYLSNKLIEETLRLRAHGKPARIYNLGCGPAGEVVRFFREHDLSDETEFTLLDFNEETLQYLRGTLDAVRQRHQRRSVVKLVKKSVHQLLKESARTAARPPENQFDFVYCAGLFDYLSDQVFKRLMTIFFDLLAPGGLLLATNASAAMNQSRPFRYSMEYLLDWHLMYRDGQKLAALAPDRAPADSVKVISESLGVNVFIEVRKPANA